MLYKTIFVQICILGLSARPQIPYRIDALTNVANIGYSGINGYYNYNRCYNTLRSTSVLYGRRGYSVYCNNNIPGYYNHLNLVNVGQPAGYNGYGSTGVRSNINFNLVNVGQSAGYNGYGSTGVSSNNNLNLFNVGQSGGYNSYGSTGFHSVGNPTINDFSSYVSNSNVNSYVDASNNFFDGNIAGIPHDNNAGFVSSDNAGFVSGDNGGFGSGGKPGFVSGDNPGFVSGDNAGFVSGGTSEYVSGGNEGYSGGDSVFTGGDSDQNDDAQDEEVS